MSSHLSKSQLWALALGDVLLHNNRVHFTCQYDLARSGAEGDRINQEVLVDAWDIRDESSAWRVLNWLTVEGGHRVKFDRLRSGLPLMTPQQQNRYISSIQDEFSAVELLIIQRYHRHLPTAGILAWDLGRAAFICHLCMTFGHIQQEEAWHYLMQNAQLIQQSYASWEEYGMAYIIGRQFWAKELEDEVTVGHIRHIRHSLNQSDSPWRILSWNMELEFQAAKIGH